MQMHVQSKILLCTLMIQRTATAKIWTQQEDQREREERAFKADLLFPTSVEQEPCAGGENTPTRLRKLDTI